MSGYLIKYHGSLIHWVSRLQSSISESSAEAELRSIQEGARDVIYLLRLEQELLGETTLPVIAYEDNKATFHQCIANASKGRMKHVTLTMLKVHEYVQKGIIDVKLVGTAQQQADYLTKPLPEGKLLPIRDLILTNL